MLNLSVLAYLYSRRWGGDRHEDLLTPGHFFIRTSEACSWRVGT